MSLTPAADWERITDYIAEELSPDAMAETERWIAEDEGRKALVEYLKQSRNAIERRQPEGQVDLDQYVAAVAQRIQHMSIMASSLRSGSPRHQGTPPRRRGWMSSVSGVPARLGWVAGFAVAVVVVLAGVLSVRLDPSTESSAQRGARYTTTIGQRANVILADGSRVTLAPKTTLTVAQGFGTASRTVALEGEAVFIVATNARHAFVVQAGAMTTKVLGTTFAVRRYPEDRTARVAVTDGKVVVSTNQGQRPSVILTAGMVGDVTDSTARSTQSADVTQYSSWVNGRLEFDEAPVSEVLAALHRWYGYQFRVSDSTLTQRHLTIGLSTESAQAALATLKVVWKVDLVFDGTMVTVVPQRRVQEPRRESYSFPRSEVGR